MLIHATAPETNASDHISAGDACREVSILVCAESRAGDPIVARVNEPVRISVPLPQGRVLTESMCELRDPHGMPIPVQARTLERWRDGSIRWLLVDFQATTAASGTSEYRLSFSRPLASNHGAPSLLVTQEDGTVLIDTGVAQFALRAGGLFPFDRVSVGADLAMDATRAALTAVDDRGAVSFASVGSVRVLEQGPLRCCVFVDGEMGGAQGEALIQVEAELHFFAGLPTARVDLTVRNPRKAEHPGGYWDLGARGSVYLKDVSLTFAMPAGSAPSRIQCWPELDMPGEAVATPFQLYQDSSGGENWQSANHTNRHRVVPNRFLGYRLATDGGNRSGLRATPAVSLTRGARSIAVTMPEFWQNFPKAVEATNEAVVLRLFPHQYADFHEIQGGEQKTHTFFVAFGRDIVTTIPLAWCRAPLLAHVPASWSSSTGAIAYLSPAAGESSDPHRALVNSAITGDHSFDRKREIIDEYGWRHFGEIYGDHEAVLKPGDPPLVSHYNNQYDAIAGFGSQFLQTGDGRWLSAMNQLARHVVDIDIYHTDRDKSAYNHGLFWHTFHYIDAGTATHRAYPRASNVGGGGPSAEHNYTTGLMLHFFLTGERRSRDAAVGLARFVIAMDDGRQTIFRWLARGRTGLATASGSAIYHGPGRAGGNSLNALIDGHRLTGDPEFLLKAEEIIRRCVHPADDIDERQLLDAERKWFYTVFLQSLGKYLDYKVELGALDDMYAYARASLLHYARWMAVYEYPYLDKPEILEYPNETWAAQDMRKSDVFLFAARHAAETERERFLERAEFFYDYSIKTLSNMPTATLARPLVLMLRLGGMREYFRREPNLRAPEPDRRIEDLGTPERFVPQKIAAIQTAKRLAYALVAIVAAAVTWWVLRLATNSS